MPAHCERKTPDPSGRMEQDQFSNPAAAFGGIYVGRKTNRADP